MKPNPNTFCIAPFKHACLTSRGKLRVCCASSETDNHDYNNIQDWYQSHTLQKLRKNLLTGIKDPICRKCWLKEETGGVSLRQTYNKHIGKILDGHFEKSFEKNKDLKKVIQGNGNYKNIETFDLMLGNHCNLKCIMCHPELSSELLIEAKNNKKLSKYYDIPDSKDFVWAKQSKFEDWCAEMLPGATSVKFTGGEPFLNPYLIKILQNLSRDQRKKCTLQFTTNLTIINKQIVDLMSDFKEVWISVSVEGIENVLEYARFGHNWNDLKKNIETLLQLKTDNLYVDVTHVIQSPTFCGIPDLVNYCDENKIQLLPTFLTNPEEFTLHSIKSSIKKELIEKFKTYKGYNKEYVESVMAYIISNIDYNKNLAKRCVERLQTFDKVRKTNFEKIIPIDYFL